MCHVKHELDSTHPTLSMPTLIMCCSHQVGCHTFCQPGPGVKRSRSQDEKFQCLACTDFCRSKSLSAAAGNCIGLLRSGQDIDALCSLQAIGCVSPSVRSGMASGLC